MKVEHIMCLCTALIHIYQMNRSHQNKEAKFIRLTNTTNLCLTSKVKFKVAGYAITNHYSTNRIGEKT